MCNPHSFHQITYAPPYAILEPVKTSLTRFFIQKKPQAQKACGFLYSNSA